MSYNPVFFITSATVSGTDLVLAVSGSPNIQVRNVASFVFARGVQVPAGADATTAIVLEIGGTEYALLDKFGMPLTVAELPKFTNQLGTYFAVRTPIACGIGSDGAETPTYHFIAFNLPVPSAYIIPLR